MIPGQNNSSSHHKIDASILEPGGGGGGGGLRIRTQTRLTKVLLSFVVKDV